MIGDQAASFIDQWLKEKKELVQKAQLDTINVFVDVASKKIDKIFKDAVTRFYSSYMPIHPDSRSLEMYDILKITPVSNGMTVGFDPSEMSFNTGYSEEDGLYDQAFRKGWHGGAASGYAHPSPGTPYYRAPYDYDFTRSYKRWYKAAATTEPPLDDFKNKLREYWEGAEGLSDLETAWKKSAAKYGL